MRELGNTDINISEIGLGCWPIGGLFYIGDTPDGYGEVDDNESVKAIRSAIDNGINFFDTSDVYGTGHSEKILGEALEGRRNKAVIATKFGYGFNESTRTLIGEIYSPEYIKRAVDASLKRLKTDYIDIYQLHVGFIPEEKVPEVFGTCEELITDGKIRSFGWSSDVPSAPEALFSYSGAVSMQYECNLLRNNPEIIEATKKSGLMGLCRSPLGMGLLSGKCEEGKDAGFASWDVRSQSYEWCSYFKNGRADKEMTAKLAVVREIICSDGRSLVEGALGWLIARSPNHVPIPGFRNTKQALEHCRAIEKGPLSQQQMIAIEKILADRA
ncbi:MAG: aldo/keto reductase [Spirochaetales bacterium]|nr:aldo/keto reductase [Spirochaetales bacterium]